MATFTTLQRDQLAAAIALGALSVRYTDANGNDRSVTYHSMDEMLRLLDRMDADLNTTAGTEPAARFSRVQFNRE